MMIIHHSYRIISAFLLLSIIALISGCGSLSPEPFTEFSQSIEKSSSAIDTVLAFNTHWAREDFIHNFAKHENSRLSSLKTSTSRDFKWTLKTEKKPLFLTIEQTRESLYEINQAFSGYTLLLLKLADKSLVNEKLFDQLAKKLNNNATEAINALTLPLPAQGVQLLSKASSEAMLLYLKQRQRSVLQTAIKQNQPNIEKYAASVVLLLNITGSQLKVYYSAQTGRLISQWRSADHKAKIKLTGKMLELNQRYIIALKNIRELNIFYKILPKANAAIAQSLNSSSISMPTLIKLNNSANRMKKLQKSLKHHLPVKRR